MKKYILVMLALALFWCTGCAKQEPVQTEVPTTAPTVAPTEAPTVPPTTEATIPVPKLSMGSALVDKTPAILDTLMRDDVVDVVGEYDEDHYAIKTDLGYGLVKKELLRLASEATYEVWTGYATKNAEVFNNLHFTGEPAQKLKTNTKVEVLDDIGYCYVVNIEDMEGFMDKSCLRKQRITSGGGSTGADGGDISLQIHYEIEFLSMIKQGGDVTSQAVVLADGTEVVLGYFERGEEIPMVAESGFVEDREGYIAVYLEGLYAYVPQFLVLADEAETYETWDGYSRWSALVYDNFYLLGESVDKLSTNFVVRVIAEFENCYVVEYNETIGFMSKDQVSKSKIPTSSGDGAEWSPPAL